MENRINNPRQVSSAAIDAILERGGRPTIQFSEPSYDGALLEQINALCLQYGSALEVRFYGHYSTRFDASIVSTLPDVQWLAVDCLQEILNADALCDLQHLRKLSLGVYYFDEPDFLSKLRLSHLCWLALSDNHRKNLDLAPLAECRDLDQIYLNGHTKNIDAISALPKLRELTLGSIAKKCTLEFANAIPRLQSLQVILGGRTDIDELRHEGLKQLSVIRVRGLETLGNLKRFPSLRSLRVEDQIKLQSISVAGTSLEEVEVHNCKNLESVDGLRRLQGLRTFRASRTKLPLDELLTADWPPSMEVLALYSSKQKWNDNARKILDERGYREFSPRWQ